MHNENNEIFANSLYFLVHSPHVQISAAARLVPTAEVAQVSQDPSVAAARLALLARAVDKVE